MEWVYSIIIQTSHCGEKQTGKRDVTKPKYKEKQQLGHFLMFNYELIFSYLNSICY